MSKPTWVEQHIEQYRKDPEKGHLWDSSSVGGPGPVPCLLLTTTGRRSGLERTTPLIYGDTNGSYVIIASKGGAPDHPDWYLNLTEQPTVEVQVAKKVMKAQAETVEGERREKLWELMVGIWPDYANYQQSTDRRIPVVVLTPEKD